MVSGVSARAELPFGFVQLIDLVRAQVDAIGAMNGLIASFGLEVGDVALGITLRQVQALALEEIIEGRFGEAAFDGDKHGLVVLVAIPVEHDQDPVEQGEDEVRKSPEQDRVLHGDAARQERLGNGAAVVHGIQAQTPGQAADEVDALADDLGGELQAGGKQGFDSGRHRRSYWE